ncbi:15-hydroxyprostaglandin dehydrogenase [NAD(+)]-like isoform X2 [Amphiura filiformis]|uniref:15-hydroxyprostaglandin dehydrogenase [NAD(+)]-like isoform X1 n=1 Tax=Amphiura filiformis TaxID=82378 RepID=UPI003B215BC0
MDIKGKVGLITGGAYGIGKKLTENLLQKGAKGVVILDVNEDNGQSTQKEFEEKYGNGKVVFQKCDVTKKEQMKAGFDLAKSKYGALHIVCNNAGFWNEVNWEKMFEVNINGVIYGTQLAIDNLEESGVIINIASVAGLALVPLAPMYATSKAAVIAYSRNMASFDPTVLAKKIRINCLCPTAVDGTNLLPSTVVEEKYKEMFDPLIANVPRITTDDVAKAFLKAIEEDHNGQSLFIPASDKDIVLVEDSSARFRKEVLGMQTDARFHDSATPPSADK